MTSWRDTASQLAQDDLDELVNAGLGAADQQLSEHGEFFPFAVARTVDGVSQLVGVQAQSEQPTAQELITGLWEALVEQREGFRAVGVVSNRETNDVDLVAVELEHVEGQAIDVTLPYQLEGGSFTPGELAARLGTPRVW